MKKTIKWKFPLVPNKGNLFLDHFFVSVIFPNSWILDTLKIPSMDILQIDMLLLLGISWYF